MKFDKGDVIMNMERIKENKLGTILQFSVPSIICNAAVYGATLTDGYFTGNYVGEQALAAINLGLPDPVFLSRRRSVCGCRWNRDQRPGCSGQKNRIRLRRYFHRRS